MKSAISTIVTGALSGPLLGARTGSNFTVGAAWAVFGPNTARASKSNGARDRENILFIM